MRFYQFYFTLFITIIANSLQAQQLEEHNVLRAFISVGANFASNDGVVSDATIKSPNLPSVNLGVQHMFSQPIGARVNFGFHRLKNETNTPDFKINYSHINIQAVFNPSKYIGVFNGKTQLFLLVGPGYSFTKPLGALSNNKQSYFNGMVGMELHYSLSRKLTIFANTSYIHGFTSLENYVPTLNGLGAFNGDVVSATVGVSIALSGCYTCN